MRSSLYGLDAAAGLQFIIRITISMNAVSRAGLSLRQPADRAGDSPALLSEAHERIQNRRSNVRGVSSRNAESVWQAQGGTGGYVAVGDARLGPSPRYGQYPPSSSYHSSS